MTTRSHSKSIVFSHPFELKGVDRILPSGDYRVVTDEELIEELSFPVYRRVASMIFVPAELHHASGQCRFEVRVYAIRLHSVIEGH